MPTYLAICEDVARESGTVPATGTTTAFSTVVGVTGRKKRIANWVADAWDEVQRARDYWLWMEGEVSASLSAGTRVYTAAALGVNSRFGRWLPFDLDGESAWTIYKTSEGVAREQPVVMYDWHKFRRRFERGSAATETGQPRVMTINPQRQIVVYPTPDAPYTFQGLYQKGLQRLSGDDDVPEAPERFHEVIKWGALKKLAVYDEAMEQYPAWDMEHRRVMGQLMRAQAPGIQRPEIFA